MANTILDKKNKVNELISVKQLLSDNHYFRVPDYQRGYAWNKEFKELWYDIVRLHKTSVSGQKHYTGMLALDEIKDSHTLENESLLGTTAFYIVDGQQRITSIVILVKALIEYIYDGDSSFLIGEYERLLQGDTRLYKFGYSVERQDGAGNYFEQRIYKNNKILAHSNQYHENINNCKEFIDTELNKFDYEDAKAILNILLNNIVFNIYFITKGFDVRVTFETMNNRGKKLSHLELLKNRLMYLTTFFDKKDNYGNTLRKKIDNAWKDIYDNLSVKGYQLSDDNYLKAHWIVYKKLDKKKGDAFIDEILNNEFAIDSGVIYNKFKSKSYFDAYSILEKYIESLGKYSLFWAFINKPAEVALDCDDKEKYWIKRLSRLTDSLYVRASLMPVLAEGQINIIDKEKYYKLLDQFIFINKNLYQQKDNDFGFLVTGARDLMIAEPNNKISKFNSMFTQIHTHSLRIEASKVESIMTAFQLYISDKSKFYYEWNGLKYFLYEYNDHLNIDFKNAAPVEWYKLSNVSIEHILPENPNRAYWKTAFKNCSGTENEQKIIHSLGNLLLLSSGAENSSLQNYSFPVKKEMSVESKKFAYCDGSRSARKVAQSEYWTSKEIFERTCSLFNYMFDEWFNEIPNFNKEKWDSILNKLNLINFSYSKLSEVELEALHKELDAIDVSNERIEIANQPIATKSQDYLKNQLLSYFHEDLFKIYVNGQNLQYKDWFTVVISKDTNEDPKDLKCGIKVLNDLIRVDYSYVTNTIKVRNISKEFYFKSLNDLNDNVKMFIRSFYRYLKKSRDKDVPTWSCEDK